MKIYKNIVYQGAASRKSVLTLFVPEKSEGCPLLIFAHGFKGYKDWGTFPLICESLAKNRFIVLAFNFSHNGGTIEQPIDFPDLEAFSNNSYSKELIDIASILQWSKGNDAFSFTEGNLSNIYLLGHSRGGGIALLAANRFKEIKKVATWAAVADFYSRLPEKGRLQKWQEEGVFYIRNGRTLQDMPMKYDFVIDLFENEGQLSIEKAVRSLAIPQLIVHGSDDETVDFTDAQLILNWNPQAILCSIDGANHTFNGKHPWNEDGLPTETNEAITQTIAFFKC